MDQNKLKKMAQTLLDESYDKSFLITEFSALPTYSYDVDKGDWITIPDSYSLFLMVKEIKECSECRSIANHIESFLGFECVVDFN
jgi:hypothetical protein